MLHGYIEVTWPLPDHSSNERVPDLPSRGGTPEVAGQYAAVLADGVDGAFDTVGLRAVAEVAQHQRGGPDGTDRVGPALTGDVRRRAVHGLEHRRTAPVQAQVGAGGESEAALKGAAEVSQNVGEQVRGDHDVDRVRPQHHAGCHRVQDRKSTRLNSSHLGISY